MAYPPISALPSAPSRATPATFSALADAFVAAFPTFRTEVNALAAYLDTLALATGPGLFLDGSAASPGISFASDLDIGFYRISSNIIGVSIGGTEVARITSAGMQLTGLLTGTAVTQSTTDTTANRISRTGDFGLGGRAPALPSSDFHSQPQSGFYRGTSSVTANVPASEAAVSRFFHALAMFSSNSEQYRNFLLTYPYNDTKLDDIFLGGTDLSGVNIRWTRIFSQGSILGTIAQTGGVPTRVFQGNAATASPAGGYSSRLGNGFQYVHLAVTSATGADTTVTFTDAFLAGSTPVVNITPVGDSELRPRIVSISATALVLSIRDSANARVAVPAHIQVSGRWSNMT